MSLNTYPNNPFPPSTEQMHRGDNEELQAQIDAMKNSATIDSFGDVETALATKTDNDVIAPEFDVEAGVYSVGDLVMHEGKLYEFTTAHETAGVWNPEEVTEKTVADEVDTLKSGLTNYQTQNDLNLEVPNRKNLFDPNSNLQLGFANSMETGGTFTSGSYYAYVVTKRSVPTFTISGVDYTKIEDASIRVFVSSSYPAVGVAQWRLSNINDLSSKTFTLSENNKYLAFLIKWEDTATQADKESIMVEEGSTATAYAPYIPSVESRIEAVESGLVNMLTDISTNTHLNKDSNLDTLPLGLYGINTYEGSGTGTGIPTYNTVGILWHIKGASNSFIQYIFGYNYFACRNRSNTTDAWEAWKFVHNALPT